MTAVLILQGIAHLKPNDIHIQLAQSVVGATETVVDATSSAVFDATRWLLFNLHQAVRRSNLPAMYLPQLCGQ